MCDAHIIPMSYIAKSDLISRYGADLVATFSREDDAVVTMVIAETCAVIDASIGKQIDVPLPSAPLAIKKLAIDMVYYALKNAYAPSTVTDQELANYRMALNTLEKYEKGVLTVADIQTVQATPTISFKTKTRVFGRVS